MSQTRNTLKKIFAQFDTGLTKTDVRKINDYKKSLTKKFIWSSATEELLCTLRSECKNVDQVSDLLICGELKKIALKNSSSVKLLNVSPENFMELSKYLSENIIEEK